MFIGEMINSLLSMLSLFFLSDIYKETSRRHLCVFTYLGQKEKAWTTSINLSH